ncbi:MAG: PIN domain-containing protein [Actinobacteria bacterium]|nr:MAG: PIN domain-containing protein [Actinomycetota bacterium]
MNAPVVVDTSVAFKWVFQDGEDSVPEAMALLDAHLARRILLVAPATLPVEVANGLRYSGLSAPDVLDALEAFEQLHLELIDADTSRIGRATSLAYTNDITVYDALFLAFAEELGCPLVTADHRAFADITTAVEIRLL